MNYRLRFFIHFILFVSVSCQKSSFNNYQKKEVVKFASKSHNDLLSSVCLVTSLPSDFKRVDKNDNITFYSIFYEENFDLCNIINMPWDGSEAVLISPSSQCGMVQQKANARLLKVKLIVYITQRNISLPDYPKELNKPPIVILMNKPFFNEMQSRIPWSNVKIGIYSPATPVTLRSKTTEIIIFVVVSSTILLTMIITSTFTKYIVESNQSLDPESVGQIKYFAIILPIVMIGMLLLLYFFYFIMVWLVIVVFYLLSAFCLATLLLLPMDKYNCLCRLKIRLNKFGNWSLDLRFIGFYLLGLVISTTWIVNRNNMTGLILNNIMGIYVCIHVAISFGFVFMISRNFKILLVILATVLMIDAVMVYVPIRDAKPYLSEQILLSFSGSKVSRVRRSDDNSIMESVATAMGGSNREEIPIRFKIPTIGFDSNVTDDTCQERSRGYSIIGFGDLILPGAFITYMMFFAVISKSGVTIYFLVTFCGYMCGLGLTYLALIMTKKGQPALIFLLPCTVLPTLLVTLIRKEFMILWRDSWFVDPSNNGFNELKSNTEDTQALPEKENEL